MNKDKIIGKYAEKRLSNSMDDRQCNDKKMNDARLRGSIGEYKANEIIKIIDDFKMRK